MQCVEAQFFCAAFSSVGPFAVPLRGAGVEVPAVVIDGLGGCPRLGVFAIGDESADFGDRFLFEVQESDNDVGNLDAGVVDVVLHVDFVAGGAEKADKRVAENCVAQMPDVRGLVGIDGCMLDQCVEPFGRRRTPAGAPVGCLGAVEIRVDVAGAGDFESGEASSEPRAATIS